MHRHALVGRPVCLLDQCNRALSSPSEPFFEQVAQVARALLFRMKFLGVARDSIALKPPTPSMREAEGVAEMATDRAKHSTAIDAAKARTIFAYGLANATFKHRVYLLS